MKNNFIPSMMVVMAYLSLVQSGLSQDVISEVKVAVVAEKADIASVVKAAAEANPSKAAEIAQAAVNALGMKSNDAADEGTIETIIQAAIEGAKAGADQAKIIRALAQSALVSQDGGSKLIQGGDTVDNRNPLNVPGMDALANPLQSFTDGGTTGGGNGIGIILGRLPAGGTLGEFIGASPGSSGFSPSSSGDLGGGTGYGGSVVNPPVVNTPAP